MSIDWRSLTSPVDPAIRRDAEVEAATARAEATQASLPLAALAATVEGAAVAEEEVVMAGAAAAEVVVVVVAVAVEAARELRLSFAVNAL